MNPVIEKRDLNSAQFHYRGDENLDSPEHSHGSDNL